LISANAFIAYTRAQVCDIYVVRLALAGYCLMLRTPQGGNSFVTLVLTTCTHRKRKSVVDSLHMSSLPKADMEALAADWAGRLSAEDRRFSAIAIYGGRGFREAATAAALLDARLMVVSAGLGLIDASLTVPPYACTVLAGSPDSVAERVNGTFSKVGWWAALRVSSPFATDLAQAIAVQPGLILAALSDTYLDMISVELCALPLADRERLRIFTRVPLERVVKPLRSCVMPYDDRLDGPDSPLRGTRSDFAARALHHFARHLSQGQDGRSVADHVDAIRVAIGSWRMPEKIDRVRHDDGTLLELIRSHWDKAGGSSSRLLRLLRDDLQIACEQGRFAALARQVREERA